MLGKSITSLILWSKLAQEVGGRVNVLFVLFVLFVLGLEDGELIKLSLSDDGDRRWERLKEVVKGSRLGKLAMDRPWRDSGGHEYHIELAAAAFRLEIRS
jgi:hypothetical protein